MILSFRLLTCVAALLALAAPVASAAEWRLPPADAAFDYQIGEPYAPRAGVRVVSRRRRDFARACRAVGRRIAVVLRDRDVTAPGSPTYRYDAC